MATNETLEQEAAEAHISAVKGWDEKVRRWTGKKLGNMEVDPDDDRYGLPGKDPRRAFGLDEGETEDEFSERLLEAEEAINERLDVLEKRNFGDRERALKPHVIKYAEDYQRRDGERRKEVALQLGELAEEERDNGRYSTQGVFLNLKYEVEQGGLTLRFARRLIREFEEAEKEASENWEDDPDGE